jgi:hypothetical protein
VRALLLADAVSLTALEFLDDIEGHRTIMQAFDDWAPSLFAPRWLGLMFAAHVFAIVTAPIVVGIIFMLLPPEWFKELKDPIDTWSLVVVAAAGTGVVLSAIGSVLALWISYKWNIEALRAVVEDHPLWEPGRRRSPADRKLIRAKDDPAYSALTG